MNILIIEDENNLALAIQQIMEEHKWQTTIANKGDEGLELALHQSFDVILTDVLLPNINGFEIVKLLRQQHIQTPILMLTALDDLTSKVKGLNEGADDYLTKPFAPPELIARIQALTRRQGELIWNELVFHDLTLSLSNYELKCNKRHIQLSYKEFEIMKRLMMHPQMITSKEELLNSIWGNDSDAIDNNVEAYISFLRKKLIYLQSQTIIKVIRRIGYRLEEKQ